MIKPLEYYFVKKGIIEHVIFNKYTIDECGVARNKKTEKVVTTRKIGKYNVITVMNDIGKRRDILVGRAVASTFLGPPPAPGHTADHIDNKRPGYDTLTNIRWLDVFGQKYNRDIPEEYKTAFLVVKNEEEKTIKEWIDHLKDEKNLVDREYTMNMIRYYAQNKQHGFSYKEYSDLPGEVWKDIVDSKTKRGDYWKISNMNRVKQITKFAENVLSGDRLCLVGGYPSIRINGKIWLCHIVSFMTFFPEKYINKKPGEMILHENDDRQDFRPQKLRLGTQSDNMKDAHDNGKHHGKQSERMRCASYIDGVLETEHISQEEASRYLKKIGYDKATHSGIGHVLSGGRKTAYGRTWEKI
jgi:hypothetical protein